MKNKELIVINSSGLVEFSNTDEQAKKDFFIKGDFVDDVITEINELAKKHVPDTSTPKGRSNITANVTKIKNKKTFLEKFGKDLSAEYKGIPKKIDATRKKIKEELNKLEVLFRKPLTDYENEQKIIEAELMAKEEAERLSNKIESDYEIALLMDEKFDRHIEDERIKDKIEAKELSDRQEKERIEHEEALKKEAAETARVEAERKNKAEQDRIVKERQDAIDKANQEIINAENSRIAAARAEELRIQQIENARIAADNAEQQRLQQVENARIDAENAETRRLQQIENAKVAAKIEAERAEKKRLNDIELAKQAEIKRQQDETDRIKRESAAREADKKWRAGVHNHILEVLINNGFSTKQGKYFIRLVALGKLPNLTINY